MGIAGLACPGLQRELRSPTGGAIATRPVTPADIAATIYHHMGIPLDTTYVDNRGRPIHIMDGPGEPIRELIA